MEVGMSLNALVQLPLSNSRRIQQEDTLLFGKRGSFSGRRPSFEPKRRQLLVVEAKGKKGMQARQFQRSAPPPLPKIEEDGNPRFVVFIRTSNVYLWYPLSVITGGTTAKIMVAAKDNFLGKYIYKDTIARNLAAVIYRDEKEIRKTAFKQYRVLRSATSFRYGYKLVENNNLRAALSTSDVIEETGACSPNLCFACQLPREEELKTVVDKVKDFFGEAASGAKESFGNLTALPVTGEESEENSK
ncbi:hypothetical protein QJS04_geneDACA016734 [Acorus gramineus]|uniref:Protein HHL1, chloroplastic n=1 Tax=Acorus gramineus TaxID=55184 RepID=A0AAV9APK8_ACOGR|nr:hypothetical protein QJS04_geneDACA016734 [Acorus gramineus]